MGGTVAVQIYGIDHDFADRDMLSGAVKKYVHLIFVPLSRDLQHLHKKVPVECAQTGLCVIYMHTGGQMVYAPGDRIPDPAAQRCLRPDLPAAEYQLPWMCLRRTADVQRILNGMLSVGIQR